VGEELDCRILGQHALLTLRRPEVRNALSISLREAISDVLDELAADPGIKAVAITGEGDVFSAGFDLREFERAASEPDFADRLWASSDRYHRRVLTFPLPTVAAVNGPAIAGGFDLAVMCDLRLAASTARFAHPERAFGDVVYGPLHDLVGGAMARELTLGGAELDAADALRCGLVGSVVEPDELLAATEELLRRIEVASREVLLRTKAKVLRSAGYDASARTLDL